VDETFWSGWAVTSYLRAPQEQDPVKTAIMSVERYGFTWIPRTCACKGECH
jgi:hypothetical protein